jgi:TonB family protein
MSIAQIPPGSSTPSRPPVSPEGGDLYDAQHWEVAYRNFDLHSFPHLLIQLQDDLARSRRREAVWISVVIHLALVILVVNSQRLLELIPGHAVVLVAPAQSMKDKDLTYLELPPDAQKITKRPDTNIVSDKDRVATSKTPQIDRQELKKILDSARAGRPGQGPAAPQAQAPPPSAGAPQQQAQVPQQPNQPAGPAPPDAGQIAKLQTPQQPAAKPKVSFGNSSLSAGSAIEQAARAALANRGSYGGSGGDGGDYGLGQGKQGKAVGELDVLSDTMGVDFGPYLSRVLQSVRQNWYTLIPESARAPLMKKGKVSIEFAIMKDGSVRGMQLTGTSGDVALDRAAWGGISASNPFPPLPGEFKGQYLALRFHFYYNPDRDDLQ